MVEKRKAVDGRRTVRLKLSWCRPTKFNGYPLAQYELQQCERYLEPSVVGAALGSSESLSSEGYKIGTQKPLARHGRRRHGPATSDMSELPPQRAKAGPAVARVEVGIEGEETEVSWEPHTTVWRPVYGSAQPEVTLRPPKHKNCQRILELRFRVRALNQMGPSSWSDEFVVSREHFSSLFGRKGLPNAWRTLEEAAARRDRSPSPDAASRGFLTVQGSASLEDSFRCGVWCMRLRFPK